MPGTYQTELSASDLVGVCDPRGDPVGVSEKTLE